MHLNSLKYQNVIQFVIFIYKLTAELSSRRLLKSLKMPNEGNQKPLIEEKYRKYNDHKDKQWSQGQTMITRTNNDHKDKQWSQGQTMITKTNNDHKDKQWSQRQTMIY